MRRRISESEAWVWVAEQIDALPDGIPTFICWHINPAYRAVGPIVPATSATRAKMLNRIKGYLGGFASAQFSDPPDVNTEERPARVLAALWLAAEAEAEERGA